ncbi:MAG TPA: serine hydrolase domain-containing protein [Acidimicrobiia bacterium]|nr:serine hydrolase domain-containing protein [Acidimicrobiia bacterium]
MPAAAPFGGAVDPAFAPVADAFRANFTVDEPELGASLCVVAGRHVVVDVWGGWTDPTGTTAWARETLVDTYSVLKPVAAVLALRLVEQGSLDLDASIAHVWPEYGDERKAQTSLRDVLSHRAGLPAVRATLEPDAMYDWDGMCAALAASEPWWTPGTGHGYHVNTYGFLAGEPVCRATGMRFGVALREHITGPLDLDLHVGLDDGDLDRVADIDTPPLPAAGGEHADDAPPADARTPDPDDEHGLMLLHAYFNPPGLSGIGVMNTPAWRRAAIPSTNGHATARAVAAFYDALLPGAHGPILSRALLDEATTTHSEGDDIVLGRPTRFGLGFALHQAARPVGVSPASFGHYGYGGSLGFADRDADVAFAYLINRPGDRWQNPRTIQIVEAVRQSL